ncbi:hypothetical protein [Ramlibacter sp.]|uniref:hypothetical protein n=1 Tax=Ramlibacter sp. TaxID=1917967 RepID=UPI002604067A|nr:hypothetical protein [Ramlibacter sp.]
MLMMVFIWVSVAFSLYRVFGWFEARQHGGEHPPVNSAGVANMRPPMRPPERLPSENHFAAQQEVIASARVQRDIATPQTQYRAPEEQRHEAPAPQTGGTIYLCRAYAGGSFWSQAYCGQYQAVIDRIVSVPPGLPFQQQVELAEQQQRQRAVSTAPSTSIQVSGLSAASHAPECKALDGRVEQLDAEARQPQSAQMQDWIRGQRQQARDRQFALHC